jgi:hypothetical protein
MLVFKFGSSIVSGADMEKSRNRVCITKFEADGTKYGQLQFDEFGTVGFEVGGDRAI